MIDAIRKIGLRYVMLNEGSLYHDVRLILISISVSFMFRHLRSKLLNGEPGWWWLGGWGGGDLKQPSLNKMLHTSSTIGAVRGRETWQGLASDLGAGKCVHALSRILRAE